MLKGEWIVVEGKDGSGKTSVRTEIGKRIEALYPNREVVYCREAGGTPVAERLRDIVVHGVENETNHIDTEILLFCAARVQLYQHVILPALARGAIVVSDRNWISSLMYQGYGMEQVEKVQGLIKMFLNYMPMPDLYVYLDVSNETAFNRMRGYRPDPDRIDSRGPEFFARVDSAYRQWAISGNDNVAIVDANKPFEHVMVMAMSAVESVLDEPLNASDAAIVKELSA